MDRRTFLTQASGCAASASLIAAGCHFEPITSDNTKTIEVALFEGGFGIEWHKDMARQYEQLHPGVKINLWGDPRVDEKIKPRVLRGNPPDLASCTLPVWKLITAGRLYPMDDALASPAYGAKGKTWKETLRAGVLADYVYEDKTFALPSNLGVWACWYSKKLFREHGWDAPSTWDELTALCEKMLAAGIAPLAFQGKYPQYAWSTILSCYQRLVPFEKWYDIQDFTKGAFLDPSFVKAADLMQELAVKYFQKGALAMTHTESQMEWANGRAGMVFCGLWLKKEMEKALPDDFEMACFTVPMVTGGTGDPKAIYSGGGESFFIFKDAKHPEIAADFLKFLLSIEPARDYVKRNDSLTPVIDCQVGIKISSALQSAVDAIEGSTRMYSDRLNTLYIEWHRTLVQQAQADLLRGAITGQQFADRLEAGAEAVRSNPNIYKPPARGVPAL